MVGLSIILLALSVPADVISVYDGDTIKVNANVWPGLTWRGSIRVRGVDTPEIRGKCEDEKARARAAKEFVQSTIAQFPLSDKAYWVVTLHNVKLGKFAGRVVADVELPDGTDLAALLIETGHARTYDGGARSGWCEEDD